MKKIFLILFVPNADWLVHGGKPEPCWWSGGRVGHYTVQRACDPSIWNDFIPIWSDVTNKTRISKISLNTIFQLSLERFISRLE